MTRTRCSRKSSGSARFLLWGVFALAFCVAFVGMYFYMQPALAAWLGVKNIVVSGLHNVERKEVVTRLALGPEASLLFLDLTELEDRLEAHPWVAAAAVGRVLPDTLTVVMTERRAAAWIAAEPHGLILDSEGFVLPGDDHLSMRMLPRLEGLDPKRLVQGDLIVRRQAQDGIKVAELLSRQFGGVPKVGLRDPSRIVVDIRKLRFRFGKMFEDQWTRFLLLDASTKTGFGAASREIDLRFPGKVIVRERR